MIRNASKALIVHGGKVLLNRCCHADGRVYYDLPGGGQKPFETMEEAVLREVLEETGYEISLVRFAGIVEEIYTDEAVRARYPDYSHRILHIFEARLASAERFPPSEKDFCMEESVWIPIHEISSLPQLCPDALRTSLSRMLGASAPLYLGTEYNPTAKP